MRSASRNCDSSARASASRRAWSQRGASAGSSRPTCEERRRTRPRWKCPPSVRVTGFVPYQETATTVPSVATASSAACSAAPAPLASIATSAPRPPVSARRRARRSSAGASASSTPSRSASARRRASGSIAITRPAPARLSSWAMSRPTVPCPKTSAVSPRRSGVSRRTLIAVSRLAMKSPRGGSRPAGRRTGPGPAGGCAGTTKALWCGWWTKTTSPGVKSVTAAPMSTIRPTAAYPYLIGKAKLPASVGRSSGRSGGTWPR